MKKKELNQSLKNSVRTLDKINNVEFNLKGNIKDAIANPIKWAEQQANQAIEDNISKYLDAKTLGKEFWDEVKNNN
tara:strand:+ start:322 stop:549 length:228 start_codon:yes stop_codon:yes gene_type:complete